ncbi:MAG: hypothetical protein CMH49_04070 [Myxococcales bacterium]|nr:hypothetical protein [Myxococcales bacterium]
MKKLINVLIAISVLAAAIFLAQKIIGMKPKAVVKPQVNHGVLVEGVVVNTQDQDALIIGQGIVEPAEQVNLIAQVSGLVQKLHSELSVGGQVRKNEKLIQIDPTDFSLAITEAKARVKIAQQEASLESGRREAAEQEWMLMEKRGGLSASDEAKGRALRKPQAKIAASNLKIAKNTLRRAQVGYQRTVLRAPFNAVILSESVDKGQLVGPGAPMASLAGTDAFWVTTSIPTSELGWIDFPKTKRKRGKRTIKSKGSKALVRYDVGAYVIEREGYVLRQLTQVETTGRMARVVIEVPDPLGISNQKKSLLLGAQVEVQILGRSMGKVVEVPRAAIHNENEVWLFAPEKLSSQGELKQASKLNTYGKQTLGQLEVRQVKILRKRKDSVLIQKSLKSGEILIVSRIPTPVPGMLLRKKVRP